MITLEHYEPIRRMYHLEEKSVRQIARELGCARQTVSRALKGDQPPAYPLNKPRQAPVLGAYQTRLDELLQENKRLPKKQRYTAHKLFELIQAQGYSGSEASVQLYAVRWRKAQRRPATFLPLEFEPGQDAQVDWGEAYVILKGQQQKVQVFVMHLSYSRRTFVMTFPAQKQEAFFYGHVEAFKREQSMLRPLPGRPFDCCVTRTVHLNGYSQVTYETNRYSVPVEEARSELRLKAYPFHIEISSSEGVLATHPRCFGEKQDVFDPLHYLVFLERRPGALPFAKPLRQWRENWPASYHQLLRRLQDQWPEGRGVKEFVQVLRLHQQHPASAIEQAVQQALSYGCAHFDGVMHCLQHLGEPPRHTVLLDLSDRPHLADVGSQPIDLESYDQLLEKVAQR